MWYHGNRYYANHTRGVYVAEEPSVAPVVVGSGAYDNGWIGIAAIIAISVVAGLLLILIIVVACIVSYNSI